MIDEGPFSAQTSYLKTLHQKWTLLFQIDLLVCFLELVLTNFAWLVNPYVAVISLKL